MGSSRLTCRGWKIPPTMPGAPCRHWAAAFYLLTGELEKALFTHSEPVCGKRTQLSPHHRGLQKPVGCRGSACPAGRGAQSALHQDLSSHVAPGRKQPGNRLPLGLPGGKGGSAAVSEASVEVAGFAAEPG